MTAATSRAHVMVEPADLAAELEHDVPPLLLDVRWSLAEPDGWPKYAEAHLPGARYVDMEAELTGTDRPFREGRHPLPAISDLQDAARRWGLDEGRKVVAYDDGPGLAAARLWWLLRDAGVASVRVLNGGMAAWKKFGGDVTTEVPRHAHGNVYLFDGYKPVADAATAADYAADGRLFDVRAGERYRGETEPADPVAGHIPGSRSAPAADSLSAGRFADDATLREHFAELGVRSGDDVAVYCGSGITAAQQALALESVGVEATLYPASWSGWLAELRPTAAGDE